MWNCKLPEKKVLAIAEQLAEGSAYKGTARVVKVSPEAVRRLARQLARQLGKHGQRFHDERVRNLLVTALEADERWGFEGSKDQQRWETEVLDPKSRLVVERVQGSRDEELIRRLLEGACSRLTYPQGVVLFSDGEVSYKTPHYSRRPSAASTVLLGRGIAVASRTRSTASIGGRRTCRWSSSGGGSGW